MANSTENNNQLNQTNRDILLSILPSTVWVHTSKILEKRHPSTLENLSNSSLYFRYLTFSRRVHFLFHKVLNVKDTGFPNQGGTRTEHSNVIKCRIVSKSWSRAIDQFIIDRTLEPDFFNTEPPKPMDHAVNNARYQYFGHISPTKLSQFLTHFQQTHLPHSSRNPFIGRVVYIDLLGFWDRTQWASIADQVSTLLRKYGRHIRILNLGLFNYRAEPSIALQNHLWLCELLENCPNLTHLKVSERFNLNDELNTGFGSRPLPRRMPPGRGEDEGLHLALANAAEQLKKQRNCNYRYEDRRCLNAVMDRDIDQDFNDVERLDAHHNRHGPSVPNHIQKPPSPPFPSLQNLQCLKIIQVSALNFNCLISKNIYVTWLHIEPLNVEKHRYINYFALEFPNLRKLYLKLCSPEDVRKLNDIHQSWLSLTHLHFEYCASQLCTISFEFMEWVEIFGVISQKWGTTLTDLKLRLPMAKSEEDKATVARDSRNRQLRLPNLKRLVIWIKDGSDGRVVTTDFLNLIKAQLEQLIIG